MDIMYNPQEMKNVQNARDSYSGRLLSDPHFNEAMMITGIVEKEIQATGRFKEVLNEYSAAYAHTKKNLSVVNAEKIIRDLFKERTGFSMNELRETFVHREESLSGQQKQSAFAYAADVGSMIEHGDKISFHRAYSAQATSLASELNITDLGAKRLMSEQFQAVQGEKLYDWGKAKEQEFYRPQIEAEKAHRAETRSAKTLAQNQSRAHVYSR